MARAGSFDDAHERFALLDDCDADAARPSSRLYTDFSHQRVGIDPAQCEAVCAAVRADLETGLHAVVLADYEWGVALQRDAGGMARYASLPSAFAPVELAPAAVLAAADTSDSRVPALRFLLFRSLQHLDANGVDAWLAEADVNIDADVTGNATVRSNTDAGTHTRATANTRVGVDPNELSQSAPAGIVNLRPDVTRAQYDDALARIDAALCAGDVYQINYTFRLLAEVFGTPLALYRRLRRSQPARYGALIARGDGGWIVSCSPELFVRHAAGRIVAKPMKGTARRGADAASDANIAAALAADPKNRAENVMIVDLLRNDLGRIATTGSVRVTDLFATEALPAVWQMTSTVEAELPRATSFAAVLRALFPCGSITGAPKSSAMSLIETLETAPRGIYTGAIGWLDAPHADARGGQDRWGQHDQQSQHDQNSQRPQQAVQDMPAACGDFCLSVAIRTLSVGPIRDDGLRSAVLGIGGGIVHDSEVDDEYREAWLKARFLTDLDPGFALFETMYATRAGGVRHLARHLTRLTDAARYFGFAGDFERIGAALQHCTVQLDADGAHRLRLTLDKRGRFDLSHAPLAPLPPGPVKVMLASAAGFAPTDAANLLLRYKTTARAEYDRAWHAAEACGAFDMLFVNRAGELTEGARSALFVKIGGNWLTPPLSAGLLPSVMRAVLLDDPAWNATEQRLTPDDLRDAEAIVVCNALRGAVPAVMQWQTS